MSYSSNDAIRMTEAELFKATGRFGPFHSAHEGFAILKEEVDELWEAVRMQQSNPARIDAMLKEAVQVGAMALRFIMDCCEGRDGLLRDATALNSDSSGVVGPTSYIVSEDIPEGALCKVAGVTVGPFRGGRCSPSGAALNALKRGERVRATALYGFTFFEAIEAPAEQGGEA